MSELNWIINDATRQKLFLANLAVEPLVARVHAEGDLLPEPEGHQEAGQTPA